MQDQVRIVIIGDGVVGASLLYHLIQMEVLCGVNYVTG